MTLNELKTHLQQFAPETIFLSRLVFEQDNSSVIFLVRNEQITAKEQLEAVEDILFTYPGHGDTAVRLGDVVNYIFPTTAVQPAKKTDFQDHFSIGRWTHWLRSFDEGEQQVKIVTDAQKKSIRASMTKMATEGLYFSSVTSNNEICVRRLTMEEWLADPRR